MYPIWDPQLILNSVALVPSITFCPQMPQRLLSLPFSFTSWLLQLSSFWLSWVFPKQTTDGSEQHCLPCLESFWNRPHFSSSCFSSLVAHWFTDTDTNKFSSLCYNCLNSTTPDYMTELLRIYKPTRQLRSSSDTSILCIATVRTHLFGQRSLSYAAPAVWNTLPYEIRSSNTISSLKSSLKPYLFQQSYWLCVGGGGGGRECEEERERERERERELVVYGKVWEFFVFHLFCFT